VADFASLLQPGEHAPRIFDTGVVRRLSREIRPVNLVQVDRVDPKPSQAALQFAPHGVGRQAVGDVPLLIPDQAAFREYERPAGLRDFGERPRYHLFRMPQAVDCSGVDPVDSQVECPPDRADGFPVILRPSGEGPAAAHGPSPKPDLCDE
jgi:hypothetical protein